MSGIEGVEREDFDDCEAGVGGFRILACAFIDGCIRDLKTQSALRNSVEYAEFSIASGIADALRQCLTGGDGAVK